MGSLTKTYKVRKKLKERKQGRDRKNRLNREGSTPSKGEFFGDKKQDAKQD